MLRLVKRFNSENPDVQVVMQRMDWKTYYNKLFVAGMGGRAPEIFVLQTLSIVRFAKGRFVRPIDDLVSQTRGTENEGKLDVSDIDPNVWQSIGVDGKHYGVPLDIWPLGMYYNRKLFRDAGIVDAHGEPRPPTNREEFMDALQKLTRPGQWGFVFANLESNGYTFMRQFGGEFFTPDHRRCIMRNPQNIDALQFCADLVRKYHYAPPPEGFDAWIGFRQGKVAMAFEGIYMLSDLKKQTDLDFGGAPVPQVGVRKGVWAGSHNLCLRADLKGHELEAAWRFVRFLSVNSLDWADGGQVPARRSLRASPRFAAMPVQSAFARQIPYLNYQQRTPYIFEYLTELTVAVEKTLRGKATPDEALQAAEARVNAVIQREEGA